MVFVIKIVLGHTISVQITSLRIYHSCCVMRGHDHCLYLHSRKAGWKTSLVSLSIVSPNSTKIFLRFALCVGCWGLRADIKTYSPFEKIGRFQDIQHKATHKVLALALFKKARKILKTEKHPPNLSKHILNLAEHMSGTPWRWVWRILKGWEQKKWRNVHNLLMLINS